MGDSELAEDKLVRYLGNVRTVSVGEKNIFFFYPSEFLVGTPITKGKLTREKYINLFNVSFI